MRFFTPFRMTTNMDLSFLQNPYMTGSLIAIIPIVLFVGFKSLRRKGKSKATATGALSTDKNFALKIKNVLRGTHSEIKDVIPELEEVLLTADVGVAMTEELLNDMFEKHSPASADDVLAALKSEITTRLTPKNEFQIDTSKKPFVIYLVGVNGVGKTTTIGKLAKQIKDQGLKPMLVAADTFRAAAVNQLQVWSDDNQVDFYGGKEGADPSSVIVDGLQAAVSKGVDVVFVDTAGRLHTKSNLMQELQKMVRMSEKVLNQPPHEIWLVVDAITGQNGFNQAQIFWEAIPLTGVILTKYDATSKGGIILSIVGQTGLPIRYVGLGEKITDLAPFEPQNFVNKIFGS